MIIDEFFLFFSSAVWENIISILKPTCFIACFFFLAIIIWVLVKSAWLYWYVNEDAKDFLEGSPVPLEKKTHKIWEKVKKKMDSPKREQWKKALIEGDEIVEDVLLKMGYKGMNLKKRLASATEAQISNLKNFLLAADICEKIGEDPNYVLERKKANEVLDIFEKFLKNFEYL